MNKQTIYIAGEPKRLLLVTGGNKNITVYALPESDFKKHDLFGYSRVEYRTLPEEVKTNIDEGNYPIVNAGHVVHA